MLCEADKTTYIYILINMIHDFKQTGLTIFIQYIFISPTRPHGHKNFHTRTKILSNQNAVFIEYDILI